MCNQIENNSGTGISIWYTSNNNTIYANNFFFNSGTKQALDNAGNNFWNTKGTGNFWNDWTGPDTTPKDGIVDLPYVLDGTPGGQDNFPLTTPQPFGAVPETGTTVGIAAVMMLLVAGTVLIYVKKKE
jgi:LPXTG-motif cell wall-anchored protein